MNEAQTIKPNRLINNRRYYDIVQVAALFECSTRTVQRIVKCNRIECVQFGREKYFAPEAVDKFIANHTVKAKKFLNKGLTK